MHKDLLNWLEILIKPSQSHLVFGSLPCSGFAKLGQEMLVDFYGQKAILQESYDLILALDVDLTDNSCSFDLNKIVSFLAYKSILLLTVNTSTSVHTRDIVNCYLANTTGLKVHATTFLREIPSQCWLIERNEKIFEYPEWNKQWTIDKGSLYLSGLNGCNEAYKHIEKFYFTDSDLKESFRKVFKILNRDFVFECLGWTELNSNETSVYFISGKVYTNSVLQTYLRVSGGGFSWEQASFLMLCEAVERASQKSISNPGLSGIAFGFSENMARLRAILEYLERFYFNEIFLSNAKLQKVEKHVLNKLSVAVRDMVEYLDNISVYRINCDGPFYIILAIYKPRNSKNNESFQIGLGCSFNIKFSVQKALMEVIQTHLYSEEKDYSSDFDSRFITPQGIHFMKFLNNLEYKDLMDILALNLTDEINCFDEIFVSNPEKTMNDWLYKNNINVKSETLYSCVAPDNGYVVRAICQGLDKEQHQKLCPKNLLPFPHVL